MKFNLDKTLGRIAPEDRWSAIRKLLDRDVRDNLAEHDMSLENYEDVRDTLLESLRYECRGLIEVRNMMTGKMVTIDANTPLCCRVDSETYWSM